MHRIMLNQYLTTASCWNITHQILKHGTKRSNVLDQSKAPLHTSLRLQSNNSGNEREFPPAYSNQTPFQWLLIKWQLLRLKLMWDTDFNESEFKAGSTQAISSITSIVSHEKYDDLTNLLTPFAILKLRIDMLTSWNDEIIRNIGLRRDDIKSLAPAKVQIRIDPLSNSRVCDIDMAYMAMKWHDSNDLLMIDIFARFNRDLSHHNSEWTISMFELKGYYHIHNYDDSNKYNEDT